MGARPVQVSLQSLSQDEAEARLKRSLTGDPTRGEIALLAALNANKFDDVQRQLEHDASLGPDLRELVTEHLKKARARWEARKAWSVTVPLPVWEEYAREAKLTGRSITVLAEARGVLERVGPLQEISMRLARIESAIGSIPGRIAGPRR